MELMSKTQCLCGFACVLRFKEYSTDLLPSISLFNPAKRPRPPASLYNPSRESASSVQPV